jgi:hypothetical protein
MRPSLKPTLMAFGLSLASLIGAPSASAAVYDLTTQSAVAVQTTYGTAIFTTDFTQPAGTGVFDPFLTIQANGVEQGYNTSAKGGVYDTKREPQWNYELQLSDLEPSRVTIIGADYYSFTIDINEPNAGDKSLISLDSLKLFASTKEGQTTRNVESLGTKLFDLDLPVDNYILYNDANSGSGQADIAFFIPVSAFAGVSPDAYIYMYQKFGSYYSADATYTTQGGFEETRVAVGVRPIPEPSAVLPLAGVIGLGLSTLRLRRRA